jgi:pteridine reductase
MDITGKTVLITGAAIRVGRSLALACAQAGADVVIHYGGSHEAASSLQAEIQALGRKALLFQAELSEPEQVSGLVERAWAWQPIDALVNNASVFDPLTWDQTCLEDWNRTLAINLTAPFLLSQAFARKVGSERTGRIVNLLDWRALRPGPDHLPYTISKAGLAALTRSLAAALAPHITVNGLALGAILPPAGGGDATKVIQPVPAGRWAELSEVNQALIFLLGGPAYITGEILHIDGGRHLV